MVFAKRELLLLKGFVLFDKITRLFSGFYYLHFFIFGLLNLPAFPGIAHHPGPDIRVQVLTIGDWQFLFLDLLHNLLNTPPSGEQVRVNHSSERFAFRLPRFAALIRAISLH